MMRVHSIQKVDLASRKPKLAVTFAGLAALSLMMAGCKVGPNYSRPQVTAPPAFRGADNADVVSDPKGSLGDEQWSAVYQEPELQALIKKALENNYDVRIAAQRILEQQAQVKITRAQEFPAIGIGGTGLGADLPGSLASQLGGNPLVDGDWSVSVSWTPDFWGQYRRQTESARATLLAQTWAQKAVRLTLVEQVATDYIQLRAYDRQLEITKQTLKARQDSLKLTQTLESGGSSPLSDVRQAEQLLYTATSEIPQLEQQIQQEENAITMLLGEDPGPIAHSDPNALAPPPQDLPTGLPSQLLERRPDIQQAEAQLISANAQIGVARAQFFPSLPISASAGLGGNTWGGLVDTAGRTIYGYGSVTQPIFQGGRLTGQLHLAEETKKELVLNYQKSIQTAFHDVSNALIALKKQKANREEQEKLVAAAQDAVRLARMRYQAGSTGYLEVLTTDTNLYTAQLNLVTAQQNEALTIVQLYGALGGGWQS